MRLSDSRLATPCDLPQRPSETPTTGLGPEFAGVRWYNAEPAAGGSATGPQQHRTGTAGEVDRAAATGQRLRERTSASLRSSRSHYGQCSRSDCAQQRDVAAKE
jgi:hypothetical protein